MRSAPSVLALLVVGACTVGPNYQAPAPPKVADWRDPSTRPGDAARTISSTTDPDPQWWSAFRDPVLSGLIGQAIAGNLDLQQAVLRVVEARQNVMTARAAGLPSLNGKASYMREQIGAKGILESEGIYGKLNSMADQNASLDQQGSAAGNTSASAVDGALGGITQPVNLFQDGLDASWELDLFGRVRRSVEQAQASTLAQAEATNDSLVMLEGQVASAYFEVRGAQALLASQQDNVTAAQQSFDLTRRQQVQGLATELDVDQARAQLDSNQQQLPGYEKQSQQAMNQLSILVGQPPGSLDATLRRPTPLPTLPQLIGIGVPSTLARRRPDIREAEAQLHAATASVGVAVASFYPDISLTGNLGIRAVDASYLTNWASHFYSAGPSLSLPIFQGGKLTADLHMARAEQAAATLNYRATVLNALREVENALVAYRTDRPARDKLADEVNAGDQALYLARDSYSHGLSNFLQVLDAQRTAISARQQLIQANVTLINDVVALYNALGGGWQETDTPIPAPVFDSSLPPVPGALDGVAASTE